MGSRPQYRRLYKTARWRGLRLAVLASSPLCVRCEKKGLTVQATVVNHRTPHKGDEALFWNRGNLEAVCKPCHDGPIQREEIKGYSREVGSDGWPTDPRHPSRRN